MCYILIGAVLIQFLQPEVEHGPDDAEAERLGRQRAARGRLLAGEPGDRRD